MIRNRSLLSFFMLLLLCFTLTGCTFNVESNLGKTALEYNSDKLEEIMDITPENADKVAHVLDEQNFGKIITHTGALVNGSGKFTVSDLKNKYVFVVENSVLSRLETEDGTMVRDLSNLANEEFSTENSSSSTPSSTTSSTQIENQEQTQEGVPSLEELLGDNTNDNNVSTLDELFEEDYTNSNDVESYTYAWSTLFNLNNGKIESRPNGGLTENTMLYNLGGNSLKDLHNMMLKVNPEFNVKLFDNIYASTVLEEGWVANEAGVSKELGAVTEQGYAILAMLIADKFDDTHYQLKNTYISSDGNNSIYLILNDGTKDYEMVLVNGTDVKITIDGADYTDKIFNENQLAKYYNVLAAIQLEESIGNVTDSDWNDYENLTGNEAPVQGTTNTNVSRLSDIITIKSNGYDTSLMERKVETYYGCEIERVVQEPENVYDGTYETADIYMEDGSTCHYFYSDIGASISDSTTTFESIWASWEE